MTSQQQKDEAIEAFINYKPTLYFFDGARLHKYKFVQQTKQSLIVENEQGKQFSFSLKYTNKETTQGHFWTFEPGVMRQFLKHYVVRALEKTKVIMNIAETAESELNNGAA